MLTTHRLALIGFGTVGQGLAEILLDKGAELAARYATRFQIVAISDLLKGNLYQPDGLDLETLLDTVRRTGKLLDYPDSPGLRRDCNSLATIRQSNADTIVEISWTDVQTGQPAIGHVEAAFESGKNAVLTNKGPVALAYRRLAELAAAHGVLFRFEGTVMSGTPLIRLAQKALAGCDVLEVRGILNGTTNFILTQMEAGRSYADALAEAQRLGYAEADPTADVEGWDAAGKTVILANVLMGGDLRVADVDRTGITQLTPADVDAARAASERWKLIARVWREPAASDPTGVPAGSSDPTGVPAGSSDPTGVPAGSSDPTGVPAGSGKVKASVQPTRVALGHPLAGVGGATNACTFTTDLLGDVTIVGPGAGRKETGYAVLGDLLDIALSK